MIDDGSGNLIQQVLMLAQLNQQKNQQQGQNQVANAQPGQTVADLGMSPRQFAAMFGKDTPYDPKRQLRDLKASDMLDTNLKNFINSADPVTLAGISASALQNKSGIAGMTTPEGLRASVATGGRAAQTAEQVSAATQPDAAATGINKARTAAIQSGSEVITAESVAGLIKKGIDSMSKQPEDVQAAAGQHAAYGNTASAFQTSELKNQVAISSLRAALDAQTNPNAPIHAFLAKNGLDLHTVMAGTSLGVSSLFDNYSRMIMSLKTTGREMDLAILRSKLETAKDMSKNVFHGKLTPNQVMAVMDSKERGTPLPKGLEGAGQVYDYAVDASFKSAIAQEIEKGDPLIGAAQAQIKALVAPGVDPYALSAVRDISRTIAAIAMTKIQIGDPPSDPVGRTKWDQVFQANKARVPGASVKMPFWSTSSSLPAAGMGSESAPVMAPTGAVAPTNMGSGVGIKPVQNVPAVGGILAPAGGPAPTGIATNKPMAALSPEDSQAIVDYLKAIGATP